MPNERKTLNDVKSKRQRDELAELLTEKARWTRQKKEAEENLEAISETLGPLMQKLDVNSIVAPDDRGVNMLFLLTRGVHTHIDKIQLINAGMDPGVIADCTVSKEFYSVSVRPAKADQ